MVGEDGGIGALSILPDPALPILSKVNSCTVLVSYLYLQNVRCSKNDSL